MIRLFILIILIAIQSGFCMSFGQLRTADMILVNGKIATMQSPGDFAEAVALKDGLILSVGPTREIQKLKSPSTVVIDLKGRTVIPGLNDSHLHIIREGLNYNMELRWDGVTTIKRALELLKEQAQRTPDSQWVKVVGGWSEYQFEEKRMPTLDEINEAVPDKPVFILYLYGLGYLNKKAIDILKYTKDTKYKDGVIEVDKDGNPTGLLIAKPNAAILYTTLGKTNKLSKEEKINSTIHFYSEMNRLGITSAIDAGGGGQNFPDDYGVSIDLAKQGRLTVRTSYYLFAQKAGEELKDYQRWLEMTKPNKNDHLFYANGYNTEGAGENIVWSAADFENFLEPRPDLSPNMEQELEPVLRLLVKNKWPFRIHATYDQSIDRVLNIIEKINNENPLNGLRWLFDHAETISDKQLNRIKKLGGGIAVQNRLYFQGESFVNRYGKPASQAPPIRKMLQSGIPVGLGTDGTRVSSYNPWLALYWACTGKTAGGLPMWNKGDILSRHEALQLITSGSAWFSGEEKLKGKISKGMYADLVVLQKDYFSIAEDEIKTMESELTIVNGKIVYANGLFKDISPQLPEIIPSWSPVKYFGGYQKK